MEIHDDHRDAAYHFELAAEHHRNAHEHLLLGNHVASYYQAQLAFGHQLTADRHAEEAARRYLEWDEEEEKDEEDLFTNE